MGTVTFYRLPKDVRQKIARLVLVRDEPLTYTEHLRISSHTETSVHESDHRFDKKTRGLPPLLKVDKKHEKEMAQIYYGENHFRFDENAHEVTRFKSTTWPRHVHLITTLTFVWTPYPYRSTEEIRGLQQFKGAKKLYISVSERGIINQKTNLRPDHDPTLNQQRLVMKASGMNALLTLSFPYMEFVKKIDDKGEHYGGSLPGGLLETFVRPKIMGRNTRRAKNPSFSFLSLTPELRNHIYSIVLTLSGPFQPSNEPPTSLVPRWNDNRKNKVIPPESALNLLLANKQIHDEACGIFYSSNAFVFDHPMQFSAFVVSLGSKRQSAIRDVTIDYHNQKIGGVDIAVPALSMLKYLTGLRRVRIVMTSPMLCGRHIFLRMWPHHHPILSHPGIKGLFNLRDIPDIKIQYKWLESEMQLVKKLEAFPKFNSNSDSGRVIRFKKLLRDFNMALADAQNGKVDKEMLSQDQANWSEHDLPPMDQSIAEVNEDDD